VLRGIIVAGKAAAARLHWRERTRARIERELRARFYERYWSGVAERSGGVCERFGRDMIRIRLPRGSLFVRGQFVQLDDRITLELAGDKVLSQQLLAEAGLPVPRFVRLLRSDQVDPVRLLADLGGQVVCKPARGHGGKAVATALTQPDDLIRAIKAARRVSHDVLVEEHVQGENFRLLYVGGKLVDVIHRRRPSLVGDGRSSLRRLMELENVSRVRANQFVAMSLLRMDETVRRHLGIQGFGPKTVLAAGQRVILSDAVNRNAAADNFSLEPPSASAFHDLGAQIRRLLPIDLLGVDVISEDIADPRAAFVINEVNTTPAPHHHVLIANPDQAKPIGEIICQFILDRMAYMYGME
jgi:D-alanine-D-alanine ligase-like ATP-grasp enzyme